jgi:hypothetical protein
MHLSRRRRMGVPRRPLRLVLVDGVDGRLVLAVRSQAALRYGRPSRPPSRHRATRGVTGPCLRVPGSTQVMRGKGELWAGPSIGERSRRLQRMLPSRAASRLPQPPLRMSPTERRKPGVLIPPCLLHAEFPSERWPSSEAPLFRWIAGSPGIVVDAGFFHSHRSGIPHSKYSREVARGRYELSMRMRDRHKMTAQNNIYPLRY